jgi:hypothetical protein
MIENKCSSNKTDFDICTEQYDYLKMIVPFSIRFEYFVHYLPYLKVHIDQHELSYHTIQYMAKREGIHTRDITMK